MNLINFFKKKSKRVLVDKQILKSYEDTISLLNKEVAKQKETVENKNGEISKLQKKNRELLKERNNIATEHTQLKTDFENLKTDKRIISNECSRVKKENEKLIEDNQKGLAIMKNVLAEKSQKIATATKKQIVDYFQNHGGKR